MKSTTKDVILLCKGYYDKEKYPTLLDALKEYYRKYCGNVLQELFDESFLCDTLLPEVMLGIEQHYPDRLCSLSYVLMPTYEPILMPDADNHNYAYQLFWRIAEFLNTVPLRGDNLTEIDVSAYFPVKKSDEVTERLELLKDII